MKAIVSVIAFVCFAVMFCVALFAAEGSEWRHEAVADDARD